MLCLDELGPLGAKVYPGRQWCPAGERPGYMPNYGKRGSLWVFGAFEPATGLVLTLSKPKRTRFELIEFLEQVAQTWTQGEFVQWLQSFGTKKLFRFEGLGSGKPSMAPLGDSTRGLA